MSTILDEGSILTLESARAHAEWFIETFWTNKRDGNANGAVIAGSIRRKKPFINDIDLLFPVPVDGESDVLYDALMPAVWKPSSPEFERRSLFDAPPREPREIFEHVRGFKPGFLHASLLAKHFEGGPWKRRIAPIKFDLWRYVPGMDGNFGWVIVNRTGSREFATAVATRAGKIGKPIDGGFLHDRSKVGPIIPTPTEESVFHELLIEFVPPEKRRGFNDVREQK